MATPRLWRDLSPAQKAYQKSRGVTPSAFNAWWKKTPEQRRVIAAKAGGKKGPAALHHVRAQEKKRRIVNVAHGSAVKVNRAIQHALTILASLIRQRVADPHRIMLHISSMSNDELDATLAATELDYRNYARPQQGWRIVNAIEVNPWWYHPG